MSNTESIKEYYNGYDEDGRLLTRYGSVEFATTMKFMIHHDFLWDGERTDGIER